MNKKTMATIGVWILAAASAVFLGHTMTSEPTAHAAAAAPVQATAVATTPVRPIIELEPVVIVAPLPRPAKPAVAATRPAPCNDGETRVVGALRTGRPGTGEGATGVRSVTLRCR